MTFITLTHPTKDLKIEVVVEYIQALTFLPESKATVLTMAGNSGIMVSESVNEIKQLITIAKERFKKEANNGF